MKETATSQVAMEPVQSLVYFSSSLGVTRVPVVRRVVLAGQVSHYCIAARQKQTALVIMNVTLLSNLGEGTLASSPGHSQLFNVAC